MLYQRRAFPDCSPAALARTLGELSGAAACPTTFGVTLAELPPDCALVEFQPGNAIDFHLPAHFPSEERRDFFLNRWACSWRLFAAVKQRHADLVGSCPFWLDDYPSGPGLAFCGNAIGNVLVPDSVYLETDGYSGVRDGFLRQWKPWAERSEKIFWRGASTGSRRLLGVSRWQDIPRFRLCLRARSLGRDDIFDIAISNLTQIWDEREREEIARSGVVGDLAPQATFMNFRHSVDIDGNTCSWPGLFTKFLMGNTVIKVDSAGGYRQWYYDRLLPWKNFVPLSSSIQELLEVADWLLAHPAEAEAIAAAGHELAGSLTIDRVLETMIAPIAECVGRWPGSISMPRRATPAPAEVSPADLSAARARPAIVRQDRTMFEHARTTLAAAEAVAAEQGLAGALARLRQLSLPDFGRLLLEMPSAEFPALSALLPRMASTEVQQRWTGGSGQELLDDSVMTARVLWHRFAEHTGRALAGGTILDFGCGYGRLLRLMYYVAEPARIFGVDPMRRSIEVCREDGVLGNLAQSDYLPSTLPVGDMRFDLIYSYSAFTHLSLRAACAALAVLRRSIKPDGLLVLTIRPVEFWSRYGLEPEVASRLQHDHAARGFAFRPHEMAPIDGDIPYGDTSMSIDWLIHQCPDWSYRGYDQGLDRLQTMILLSPA